MRRAIDFLTYTRHLRWEWEFAYVRFEVGIVPLNFYELSQNDNESPSMITLLKIVALAAASTSTYGKG